MSLLPGGWLEFEQTSPIPIWLYDSCSLKY